jgi:hypothetical protein
MRRNPHSWSPIISSEYVVNLDSRMLYNIVCVDDKNELPLQVQQFVLSPFL